MENVSKEIESMKSATAEARLAAEIVRNVDRQNKRLWTALIAALIAIVIAAAASLYGIVHIQDVANQAILNALNTVAEMEVTQETTTTQTVEGDSATINNVEGEQYNDNATNQTTANQNESEGESK